MYKISASDRYGNFIEVEAKQGETLFCALGRYQPPIFKGNCGGRGQCMSCTVFVKEKQTYVKACRTLVEQDLHVVLPFSFGEREEPKLLPTQTDSDREAESQKHSYGVAVDIGTTSVGLCLMDLDREQPVCTHTLYNPQTVYGADVISRIAYAGNSAHAKQLQSLIWEQLAKGIQDVLAKAMLTPLNLKHMSIAANTTMLHLLLGYDVTGLGAYPFHTKHLQGVHRTICKRDLGLSGPVDTSDMLLSIYPGCSAFVGADIVAGAIALSLGQKQKYDLLIDLGTNGELLLVNTNQGYAGATACGSAFDAYVTAGAYSTDLFSRIVLLRERGIIRSNGSLMERYLKTGYVFPDGVTVTQEMIENLLKAKAAIRTGIDMLLEKAGVLFQSCNVYVAGNFGFHLDVKAAKALGMFPEEGEIMIAGNTALEGAKKLLMTPSAAMEEAKAICSRTDVLEFANDSGFAGRYIKQMFL